MSAVTSARDLVLAGSNTDTAVNCDMLRALSLRMHDGDSDPDTLKSLGAFGGLLKAGATLGDGALLLVAVGDIDLRGADAGVARAVLQAAVRPPGVSTDGTLEDDDETHFDGAGATGAHAAEALSDLRLVFASPAAVTGTEPETGSSTEQQPLLSDAADPPVVAFGPTVESKDNDETKDEIGSSVDPDGSTDRDTSAVLARASPRKRLSLLQVRKGIAHVVSPEEQQRTQERVLMSRIDDSEAASEEDDLDSDDMEGTWNVGSLDPEERGGYGLRWCCSSDATTPTGIAEGTMWHWIDNNDDAQPRSEADCVRVRRLRVDGKRFGLLGGGDISSDSEEDGMHEEKVPRGMDAFEPGSFIDNQTPPSWLVAPPTAAKKPARQWQRGEGGSAVTAKAKADATPAEPVVAAWQLRHAGGEAAAAVSDGFVFKLGRKGLGYYRDRRGARLEVDVRSTTVDAVADSEAAEQLKIIAWLERLVGTEEAALKASMWLERTLLDRQQGVLIAAREQMQGRDDQLRRIQRCCRAFLRRLDAEEMRKLGLSWPDAATPRFAGSPEDDAEDQEPPPGAALACAYHREGQASGRGGLERCAIAAEWEGHLRVDAQQRELREMMRPRPSWLAAHGGAYKLEQWAAALGGGEGNVRRAARFEDGVQQEGSDGVAVVQQRRGLAMSEAEAHHYLDSDIDSSESESDSDTDSDVVRADSAGTDDGSEAEVDDTDGGVLVTVQVSARVMKEAKQNSGYGAMAGKQRRTRSVEGEGGGDLMHKLVAAVRWALARRAVPRYVEDQDGNEVAQRDAIAQAATWKWWHTPPPGHDALPGPQEPGGLALNFLLSPDEARCVRRRIARPRFVAGTRVLAACRGSEKRYPAVVTRAPAAGDGKGSGPIRLRFAVDATRARLGASQGRCKLYRGGYIAPMAPVRYDIEFEDVLPWRKGAPTICPNPEECTCNDGKLFDAGAGGKGPRPWCAKHARHTCAFRTQLWARAAAAMASEQGESIAKRAERAAEHVAAGARCAVCAEAERAWYGRTEWLAQRHSARPLCVARLQACARRMLVTMYKHDAHKLLLSSFEWRATAPRRRQRAQSMAATIMPWLRSRRSRAGTPARPQTPA
eukprot:g1834.t1